MPDTDLLPGDMKPNIDPELPGNGEIAENDPSFIAAKDQMHAEASSILKNADKDKKDSASKNEKGETKDSGDSPGDKVGKGFSQEQIGSKSKALSFMQRNKKNIAIGGSVTSGLVLGLIFIFLSLIPLKIKILLDDLQAHYTAADTQAVGDEVDNLVDDYIEKDVGEALTKKSCGTTLVYGCHVDVFGDGHNPIYNLFKNWSNDKLEYKLANDYHIIIKYDTASKTYYMKAPGITTASGEEAISKAGEGHIDADMFVKVDAGTIRDTIHTAAEDETGWQKAFYRYRFDEYLSEKWQIKWCLFFCSAVDPIQKFVRKGVNDAQVMLVRKVLTPLSVSKSVILQCLLNPNCEPEKQESPTPETEGSEDLNGQVESATEAKISLEEVAVDNGIRDTEAINSMVADYKNIDENGWQKVALQKALAAVGLDELAENASNAVPIIGWIKTAAAFIAGAAKLGPKIRKLVYITNSRAAVATYAMYLAWVSEMQTGHTNAAIVNNMENSLGPGDFGSSTDPEVGGTADATQTPLYQELNSGDDYVPSTSSGTSVSLLSTIFPSAFADSTQSSQANPKYLCNNGKPVPSGKLVCPEEVLGQGNAVADNVSGFLKAPGVNLVTDAANDINNFTGPISTVTGDVISSIPGLNSLFGSVAGLVGKAVKPAMTAVVTKVVPDPFGANMSGGRTYDMIAAGADVSGSDYAHYGIGGKKLNPTQMADIENEQQSEDKATFNSQPIFARIFSTNSPYSLISRVAMALPLGKMAIIKSFASIITNPFRLFNDFFGFLTAKVSADNTPIADPFGVPQYGYTDSDIAQIGDPYTYYENNCLGSQGTTKTQNWDNAVTNTPVDPNTQMPVNNTTDPCLLIQAAIASAGAEFDSSLLTPDEQQIVGNSAAGSSNSSTSSTTTQPSSTSSSLTINNAAAEKIAKSSGANVGYALYASSGKQLASFNSSFENYGASITKSMILVAYLDQIGSAKPSPYVTGMIEQSSDTDANSVLQLLKDPQKEIDEVASKAGMTGFKFNITGDSLYWLGQSQITANDFAKFFAKIDTMFPASQKSYALNLLSNISNQAGLLKAGLPSPVYSKEGWKPEPGGGSDPAKSGSANPFGLEGMPYIVNQAAEFTVNGSNYGVAVTVSGTQNEASGEKITQNVASALIQESSN